MGSSFYRCLPLVPTDYVNCILELDGCELWVMRQVPGHTTFTPSSDTMLIIVQRGVIFGCDMESRIAVLNFFGIGRSTVLVYLFPISFPNTWLAWHEYTQRVRRKVFMIIYSKIKAVFLWISHSYSKDNLLFFFLSSIVDTATQSDEHLNQHDIKC